MKIVLVIFCCLLFGFNAPAQTEIQDVEAVIETVSLARDDGSGKPGDAADGFFVSDVPIHCLIDLSSHRAVTVKMNLVAVNVKNIKIGASVIAVSYKTNGQQNRVRFNASPEGGVWAAGTYRIDVLLDGKIAKSLEFEIVKTPQQIEREKQKPSKPLPIRGKKLQKSRNA